MVSGLPWHFFKIYAALILNILFYVLAAPTYDVALYETKQPPFPLQITSV